MTNGLRRMTEKLKAKIKQLETTIQGMIAERGIFYTELLKICIIGNYTDIIEFLNPTPEELSEIQNQKELIWCENCKGYMPLFGNEEYLCPNCNKQLREKTIKKLRQNAAIKEEKKPEKKIKSIMLY